MKNNYKNRIEQDDTISPADIGLLIDLWISIGLTPIGEKDSQKLWKD